MASATAQWFLDGLHPTYPHPIERAQRGARSQKREGWGTRFVVAVRKRTKDNSRSLRDDNQKGNANDDSSGNGSGNNKGGGGQ